MKYYNFLERKDWNKNKHYSDYSKILFKAANFISLLIITSVINSFETISEHIGLLILPTLILSIFYFNYYRGVNFKVKKKLNFFFQGKSIYDSNKNVFLIESIEYSSNNIKTEQNLSSFSELLLFTFIIIIIATPIYKLLGIDYFI
ncbi:hypothetical protein [Tenacibaculum sp. ZS6-P6]|uniref:hypothetical protein n=1 Tax=Tenacibaculum sp. ZS6-P6 TaxID=3447503 RepID=UPI003F98E5A8